MTPQLYIKLTAQVARQTIELEAVYARVDSLQPAVDSAVSWEGACQVVVDSAQARLTEVQQVEGADSTAQQAALDAANASLESATKDLAAVTAMQDEAIAKAVQLRKQIADCQALLPSADTFTEEELAAAKAPVPESVEMVQARLALHEAGITAAHVAAVIAALPEPAKSFAAIEWEFRPRVRRDSALVVAIGKALNLTDAQIDALFIKAAQK